MFLLGFSWSFMKYKNILLAVFSGILLIFIFPALNFSILSWIALIPLLLSIKNKSLKESFLLGFLAGLIAFSGLLYWLILTLVRYGGISYGVSLFVFLLLVSYLALYIACFSWAFRFFTIRFPVSGFRFLYGGCLWVSLELLRTYLFTGFPWVLLGYSQWRSLAIIQISELTGVYGVSFLIVMVNVAIAQATEIKDIKKRMKILLLPVVVILLCLVYGVFVVSKSSNAVGEASIKVSVIQANINQDVKWDELSQFDILDKYEELTRRVSKENSEIIVWPETAVPGYLRHERGLFYRVSNTARLNNVWLIVGGPDFINDNYYNAAFLISPKGEIADQYNKIHLVLFGEKVPLRKPLSKFFKILDEMGDYTPGEGISLLETPSAKFGVVICFESIFPDLFRRFVKSGADVMVNITEDCWYGRTSAPWQHFSVNIFRAVENRTPVIRVANTGISGFIDPYGRVRKSSAIFTEDFLTDDVLLREKTTFYTRYGDIFSYLCVFITVLFVVWTIVKKKN